MNAAEAMYFDNAPNAHVVAYEDRQLQLRRDKANRALLRDWDRRRGSRSIAA